jgi:signal transduction histidine kinase
LSLTSYEYSQIASTRIQDLGAQEARGNAQIQAHDLASVLERETEAVSNNLQLLSSANALRNQDVPKAMPLLSQAQNTTKEITLAYGWLDQDGKSLWSTSYSNKTLEQLYRGGNFSTLDTFQKTKETQSPYYSTAFVAIDKVQRLQIGYPILADAGTSPTNGSSNTGGSSTFRGTVIAAINIDVLGKFLKSQLIPNYNNTVGLLDRNGVILYSDNSTFVGKNIFSSEVQSAIPGDIKDPFDNFVRDSLKGNVGIGDFSTKGLTSTLAYEPVKVKGYDFAVLFVVAPHHIAGSAAALLDQQQLFNVLVISAVGITAAGIAAIVLAWNKRLSNVVAAKTSELTKSNEQLQQANEQLKVHDRLQKEFINIAAHELRTPVQPLVGCAELIESQFQDNKDTIEITRPEIEMIIRNAKRLERLSTDILEISRIESGSLVLNKEQFSLAYVIAQAVKDARAQHRIDHDELQIIYHADDIFVYADKEKTTEVLMNLIGNALKFTKKGQVSIVTSKDTDKGMAMITIKDTGPGIDSEIIPKLFEKFVTKSDKGTGIGLYVSKKIVEAHGGTISGQNNPDGIGATFRFTLPLAETNEEDVRSSSGRSHISGKDSGGSSNS